MITNRIPESDISRLGIRIVLCIFAALYAGTSTNLLKSIPILATVPVLAVVDSLGVLLPALLYISELGRDEPATLGRYLQSVQLMVPVVCLINVLILTIWGRTLGIWIKSSSVLIYAVIASIIAVLRNLIPNVKLGMNDLNEQFIEISGGSMSFPNGSFSLYLIAILATFASIIVTVIYNAKARLSPRGRARIKGPMILARVMMVFFIKLFGFLLLDTMNSGSWVAAVHWFPAILTMNLIDLTQKHGPKYVAGTLAATMVSHISASVYSIILCMVLGSTGYLFSVPTALAITLILVNMPALFYLRHLRRKTIQKEYKIKSEKDDDAARELKKMGVDVDHIKRGQTISRACLD